MNKPRIKVPNKCSNLFYDSFATNLYIKNPFIFVGKFNDLEKFNEDINKDATTFNALADKRRVLGYIGE